MNTIFQDITVLSLRFIITKVKLKHTHPMINNWFKIYLNDLSSFNSIINSNACVINPTYKIENIDQYGQKILSSNLRIMKMIQVLITKK